MNQNEKIPSPVFTTSGETAAMLAHPYLYNLLGEWVGWVTEEMQVYSVHGDYVGWMSSDPRILRKRTYDFDMPKRIPPPPPPRVSLPATMPLPPLMPELTFDTIDVLEEYAELMPTVDAGELRPDLD